MAAGCVAGWLAARTTSHRSDSRLLPEPRISYVRVPANSKLFHLVPTSRERGEANFLARGTPRWWDTDAIFVSQDRSFPVFEPRATLAQEFIRKYARLWMHCVISMGPGWSFLATSLLSLRTILWKICWVREISDTRANALGWLCLRSAKIWGFRFWNFFRLVLIHLNS